MWSQLAFFPNLSNSYIAGLYMPYHVPIDILYIHVAYVTCVGCMCTCLIWLEPHSVITCNQNFVCDDEGREVDPESQPNHVVLIRNVIFSYSLYIFK